jgi:hypothetical protein
MTQYSTIIKIFKRNLVQKLFIKHTKFYRFDIDLNERDYIYLFSLLIEASHLKNDGNCE